MGLAAPTTWSTSSPFLRRLSRSLISCPARILVSTAFFFPYLADSSHFIKNIRKYNNALSFTSTGVKRDPIMNSAGPPTFKIQGELHHFIGSLLPPAGTAPAFLQLYINDPEHGRNAASVRHGLSDVDLRPQLLDRLLHMMITSNPFAHALRSARERLADNHLDMRLSTFEPRATDPRRFNRPASHEVAALIVPGPNQYENPRDLIVQYKSSALQRISETHPGYLPLRYVLMLPCGTQGWLPRMPLGFYQGYIADARPAPESGSTSHVTSPTDLQEGTSLSASSTAFTSFPASTSNYMLFSTAVPSFRSGASTRLLSSTNISAIITGPTKPTSASSRMPTSSVNSSAAIPTSPTSASAQSCRPVTLVVTNT